ncbi:MAG: NERD domain-containing protein/DEAD/DEAH box helicase, partial [Dokdonella sp.]
DWVVIHGCHWTLPTRRRLMQGEIDFIVISPAGAVALIEQKNGNVGLVGVELVKHYGDHSKSVSQQMSRNRDSFLAKLERQHVTRPTGCISVGYFPDARIDRVHDIALDSCCIVDQGDAARLPTILTTLIGGGDSAPDTVEALCDFLEGRLELVPSLHGQRALADQLRIHLSGPMRLALEQFQMQPMRLRVEACAGSGKSELLRVMARRAITAGRHVLLVCFNRPLAELHRNGLAGATVETWFGLRRRMADTLGIELDFGDGADWSFWRHVDAQISTTVAERGVPDELVYDTILVDEGQDLPDDDIDRLLELLSADGDFIWVGDPDQDLMTRSADRHRGHAVLRILDNYRTPARLAAEMAAIAPAGIRFVNPVEGSGLSIIRVATDDDALRSAIATEVDRLLALGLDIADLMIVGLQGMAGLDALGEQVGTHRLRRFSGRYSDDGEQLMTDGTLITESVARAKGRQCAHVLVIGGGSADMAHANWQRSLYVALTRATIGATLFVGDDASGDAPPNA